MTDDIRYPLDPHHLLRKKRSIRRSLLARPGLQEKRVAILGGSTTAEVKDMLELFLLDAGIRPVFYESEYNKFYEDVMFDNPALRALRPDIVYIHTSGVNVTRYPSPGDPPESVDTLLAAEVARFTALWDRIGSEYGCPVIQNNFELPHYRLLGNLDASDARGRTSFVNELNHRFAEEARRRPHLYLNDIHYLAAWFGLERWYDKTCWYSYKYAMSLEAIPMLADSVATIIKAICGRSKKCLVLDLDNTLWGGVIGDDGLDGIRIGKETPEAEAFTEFQGYVKGLKERGVLLAVCSKNDDRNAREGFTHPDSVLSISDFAEFRANWDPKHENVLAIARALNIGVDSLVFVDDNPAEREIVRAQAPEVAVPELSGSVARYIDVLDKTGYFETVSLSADDLQRSAFYSGNAAREDSASRFATYDDFLRSLEMTAEIRPFTPVYLDRITQLTNKTNQFNVTTRRYTSAEIETVANDSRYVTLYGRLRDKFGDNGLVSVVVGQVRGEELHIDLWLMSCRVLKRGMEAAMLDQLIAAARARGVTSVVGYYRPTAKNGMVREMFADLGFAPLTASEDGETTWRLEVSTSYVNRNLFIEVTT